MRSILGRSRVTHKGSPLLVRLRQPCLWHERQLGRLPRLEAALEGISRGTFMAQPGGDAMAELFAALAEHDDRAATEFLRPLRHLRVGTAQRGGKQPGIGLEIIVDADIDERRRFRRADEARQLFDGDVLIDDMMRPLVGVGRDALACRLVGRSQSP